MDDKEVKVRCLECAEKWTEHVNKMKGQLVGQTKDVLIVSKVFEKYVKGD